MRTSALSFAVLMLVAVPAQAADDPAQSELAPRRVAVMPLRGKGHGLGGSRIAVKLAEALRDTRRFEIIPPARVARTARRNPVARDEKTGAIAPSAAASFAEAAGADGVLTGWVEETGGKTVMRLSLLSKRGIPIAQVDVPLSSAKREAFRAAAADLQSKLPFAGVVIRVDGYHALINMGSVLGVKEKSRLYAFEYESIRLGEDAYEVGEKRGTAELEVIRVAEHAAWVRTIRGDLPSVGSVISIREIAYRPPPAPQVKPKRRRDLQLHVGTGIDLLTRDYALDSNEFRFDSESNVIMAPAVTVDWSPLSLPWFDVVTHAEYRHGFVPTHSDLSGTDETYSASLDQVRVDAGVGRRLAQSGWFGDARVGFVVGYRLHAFRIEDQSPRVLTSDTYHQVTVGTRARIPVARWLGRNRTQRVWAELDLHYAPVAVLSEKPVDNGDPSTIAAFGSLGARYNVTHRIHASAALWVDHVSNDFGDGGGSRGLTNPQSRDVYTGLLFRVEYRLGSR